MRLLAPTVAVSQAPISEVLAALREAGFAPAAEDSTGTIVDIRARGARVPAPPRRRAYRPTPRPTSQTLGAIVAVLRKVAATPSSSMRLDPTVAIAELQEAAHQQASVVIGYVDPAGVATQRVVAPINVRGGQLTAYDPASGRVREFAIHRVTSVVSADEKQRYEYRGTVCFYRIVMMVTAAMLRTTSVRRLQFSKFAGNSVNMAV